MKICEVMSAKPKSCTSDANLAMAAELMWNNDCGVLPITMDSKVVGVITDRDICIALGTRNQTAAEIAVKDVAVGEVHTCRVDDDVRTAMATMRRTGVRRLPVLDDEGRLEGIVALNDFVLAADVKRNDINNDEVMATIKAVSQHRDRNSMAPGPLVFMSKSTAIA